MRILLLLGVLPLAWAQFPAVCNTPDSLSTKTCCPDYCGSHRTCVSNREVVERSWDSANVTIVDFLLGEPGWPQTVRGLLGYLSGFAPAVKDREAMTAANVTLDSLPMQQENV